MVVKYQPVCICALCVLRLVFFHLPCPFHCRTHVEMPNRKLTSLSLSLAAVSDLISKWYNDKAGNRERQEMGEKLEPEEWNWENGAMHWVWMMGSWNRCLANVWVDHTNRMDQRRHSVLAPLVKLKNAYCCYTTAPRSATPPLLHFYLCFCFFLLVINKYRSEWMSVVLALMSSDAAIWFDRIRMCGAFLSVFCISSFAFRTHP